jgi:BirA family biotin operon repressor/biotin-[acetyl-CoA-carboxylase] ligase
VLDSDAIRALTGWDAAQGEIRALGSVTSTSDIAWAWAEAGCPSWTVVLAEEQIQGRGRFGRTWHCPRGGGVLMSVVLRPPGDLGAARLTALGAVAVAEAVEELGPKSAIQWPNDIVVRHRKIAGVLVEWRRPEPQAPCLIGVGLNVNVRREQLPEPLRGRATSLSIETRRRTPIERAAATVLLRLAARYRDAVEGRWGDVAAAWRQRSILVGEWVDLESRGEAHRGRVLAVDLLDGIEIELAGGERRVFPAEWTSVIAATPAEPEARPT